MLCAATLALHYAAIDWVGGRLAAQTHRPSELPPSLMTAQLKLSLPKRVESAPVEEIKPLAEAPRKPLARPKPPAPSVAAMTPASMAPEMAQEMASSAAVLAAASDLADVAVASGQQAGAAQAQTGTPPPEVAQGETPAAATPDAGPRQGGRRYKVNLPPSATFELAVDRVDADGTKWTGAATMTWHTDGSHYQASVEAGVSLLITRINLLVLRSEGTIDDAGIAPVKVTEKRTRRAETATHFNRDAGTISFSASERSYPLLPGAQDKATVPFQLGGIGRADINQFGSDVDIQVGEDKEATMFRFQLVGEEEIDTKMGKLVTWHLSRPPKPGSYSSRLDIWLAPGLNWYPVQIRNTEASGALTTQTVSNMKMTDK
ncbi:MULTISPECIES: DUF3108 domain-containing protein [unclassified Duganella]|uniref:DUF3108 domain-containing protein n=1 Tax=unclassified Duganella TaxID=2636909 RepID=UPI00088A2688|nr:MULTISPECIES: DUF3108 domain-containing protein [unclassified Duganella]SDH17655.1 Protein of unknown function [Duganella sp. OV458]SDK32180.1 Protein of unknown function [Duganella sp. OV510]